MVLVINDILIYGLVWCGFKPLHAASLVVVVASLVILEDRRFLRLQNHFSITGLFTIVFQNFFSAFVPESVHLGN